MLEVRNWILKLDSEKFDVLPSNLKLQILTSKFQHPTSKFQKPTIVVDML